VTSGSYVGVSLTILAYHVADQCKRSVLPRIPRHDSAAIPKFAALLSVLNFNRPLIDDPPSCANFSDRSSYRGAPGRKVAREPYAGIAIRCYHRGRRPLSGPPPGERITMHTREHRTENNGNLLSGGLTLRVIMAVPPCEIATKSSGGSMLTGKGRGERKKGKKN